MGKLTNKWKLNNIQLYSHCVKKKIKREIRKYFNTKILPEINPPHTKTYMIQQGQY